MNHTKAQPASPDDPGILWAWMGRHKKKLLILLACAVVLAAAALVIYTRPRPLINSSGPYLSEPEIHRVEIGGETITDQVDLDELMAVLQDTTYRKSVFPGWNSYQASSDLIEMTIRTGYDYEILVILASPRTQYVCDFSTPTPFWHQMTDGEPLYDALLAVIEPSLQ